MKKHEVVFNAKKEVVAQKIMETVKSWVFAVYDSEICGKISKNNDRIKLYHGSGRRNSFRLFFVAKLIEQDTDKTVLKGHWRMNIAVSMLYLVMFMGLLVNFIISVISFKSIAVVGILLFLMLFFIGVLILGIRIGSDNRQKVLDYIKTVQEQINGGESYSSMSRGEVDKWKTSSH